MSNGRGEGSDPASARDGDTGERHSLGRYPLGLGRGVPALAARHRRHRLDRHVVLLHPARLQPETPRGPARGRPRRSLAGARRRLLQHGEVPGGAGAAARGAHLVQVGGLRHLDLGLRAGRGRSTTPSASLYLIDPAVLDISPATGIALSLVGPGARLDGLRRALPLAARPQRDCARRRRLRLPRRARLAFHAASSARAAPSCRWAR